MKRGIRLMTSRWQHFSLGMVCPIFCISWRKCPWKPSCDSASTFPERDLKLADGPRKSFGYGEPWTQLRGRESLKSLGPDCDLPQWAFRNEKFENRPPAPTITINYLDGHKYS